MGEINVLTLFFFPSASPSLPLSPAFHVLSLPLIQLGFWKHSADVLRNCSLTSRSTLMMSRVKPQPQTILLHFVLK